MPQTEVTFCHPYSNGSACRPGPGSLVWRDDRRQGHPPHCRTRSKDQRTHNFMSLSHTGCEAPCPLVPPQPPTSAGGCSLMAS
eukprot:scaffold8972_cov118-Isochrysis_galbana.AAC.6